MGQEIERKFILAAEPDSELLERLPFMDIEQTYLSGTSHGLTVRIRRVTSGGTCRFVVTRKRFIARGIREEDEREISEAEYQELLGDADLGREQIRKRRYLLACDGRTFELDLIKSPRRIWLLELEVSDPGELDLPLTFPPGILVAAEVTGDPRYGNSVIAAGRQA